MKVVFRIVSFLCLLSLLLPVSATAVSQDAAETAAPAELKLNCKSAILLEQTTGQILYEKNPGERLPIASVTKIMTLLLAMEALEAGTVSLEDPVPISETAASMGGSQVYLEVGETITLHEILKAVFVSSANDGAVALAELISGNVESFVAAMNDRAAALGMHDTVFYNPTGLDDAEINLSTAHDVALMSNALLRHQKIYEYTTIWIDSIRDGAFGLSNTNKLIRFYPGATGLKTGSTGKAKYCISASAERNGLKLCAVVLGGESSNDRFQAAKSLLDYGFAGWAYYQPQTPELPRLKVSGGVVSEFSTETRAEGILLPKKEAAGIQIRTQISQELQAPVLRGQVVGRILYEKGDTVLHEIPIYAAEDVERLGFWELFSRLLTRFFSGSLPS